MFTGNSVAGYVMGTQSSDSESFKKIKEQPRRAEFQGVKDMRITRLSVEGSVPRFRMGKCGKGSKKSKGAMNQLNS